MKKSASFSVLCHMLYVTCFMISACVPHELEAPVMPEAAPPRPKTLQEEVEAALSSEEQQKFYTGSIPVGEVWKNINYSSFNYKKFFKTACPNSSAKYFSNGMSCDFTSENENKKRIVKFKISSDNQKTIVEIEQIGYWAGFIDRSITAFWEITKNTDGFFLKKYEKLGNDIGNSYLKVETTYKDEGAIKRLEAAGRIRFYGFSTEDVRYGSCASTPKGILHIDGKNTADIFFDPGSECKDCALVKLDGYYKYEKYCFNGPWILGDLFDYLKPFLGN